MGFQQGLEYILNVGCPAAVEPHCLCVVVFLQQYTGAGALVQRQGAYFA